MKIYFGFTMAGDRSSLAVARRLVEMLEAIGHEVLTRHLVADNATALDRAISPREVYERDMTWLEEADLLIAEVSGSSFGLGFEAGYVLGSTRKRVVLFYRREVENRISLMITGNSHPHCRLIPYSETVEIEEQLRAALG